MKLFFSFLFFFTAHSLLAEPFFPQPQFARANWVSLNGPWEFQFDDTNVGEKEKWFLTKNHFNKQINVPFPFESLKSGIHDVNFHRYIWYKKKVKVPASWKASKLILHFGAIDYWSTVWINGRRVQNAENSREPFTHEGGNVPFAIDLSNYLNPTATEFVIVVRADDPPEDLSIPRGKQYWNVKSEGIYYTRTSGIWQHVWLEGAGSSYVEKLKLTPTINGQLKAEISLSTQTKKVKRTLGFKVNFGQKTVVEQKVVLPPGVDYQILNLTIANPQLWSPQFPNLYQVSVSLTEENSKADEVGSYFGFRDIKIKDNMFHLNGKPVFLKFILDQGYWPESILAAPSDEALKRDVEVVKQMGFNGARKHQKLEDPRYLYWADKLGLLVSSEMASTSEPVFTDFAGARFAREWKKAVERDYNHPSIIMWVPMNESWGVLQLQTVPKQAQYLRELYDLTKSIDSTRPVIDNEGWEHTEKTDLFAQHDYSRNGQILFERYKNLGIPKPGASIPPVPFAPPALVPGSKYNGSPFYLSEFGGIGFVLPGQPVPDNAWGYEGAAKTEAEFFERMTTLYQAINNLPGFSGLCYTQLTDVEQEINGLLTYDRRPKFSIDKYKQVNDIIKR